MIDSLNMQDNKKLQQLEAKIKKLVDLHINGAIDRDIYNEKQVL
ncbi:hypothetical protein AN1V17_05910 [Vallitalea sediminicola]